MMKTVLTLAMVLGTAMISLNCSAQLVGLEALITDGRGDVRIAGDITDSTGGSVGDENGGFTSLVVGISSTNVNNWALLGYDTSDPGGLLAGQTIVGAELFMPVQTGFGGGANHGSAEDTFTLHELLQTNTDAGWDEGGGFISGNRTGPDGTVTYIQRAFNTIGEEWLDASGNAATDFRGTYDSSTAVNSNQIVGWESGSAPDSITFEITDLDVIEGWLSSGTAELVIQVNDGGSNTSRFNLNNNGSILRILVVPEPSSAAVICLGLAGLIGRRRRTC